MPMPYCRFVTFVSELTTPRANALQKRDKRVRKRMS